MEKLDAILSKTRTIKPPAKVKRPPVAKGTWEEAVGSRIARRAEPARIERGTLIVRCANAAWANELSMLADDILAQLVHRGVKVKALRFYVGRVARDARRKPEVRNGAPRRINVPAEVAAQVAHIEDPELRDAIAQATAKTLLVKAANEG